LQCRGIDPEWNPNRHGGNHRFSMVGLGAIGIGTPSGADRIDIRCAVPDL
jgi:hypothetical protein